MRILPIHISVPGRGRFKVQGLTGNAALKRYMEEHLTRREGIFSVSASVITGNVLVLFSTELKHRQIMTLIAKVIEGPPKQGSVNKSPRVSLSSNVVDVPSAFHRHPGRSLPQRVHRRIRALLRPKLYPPQRNWHVLDERQVLELLATNRESGLTFAEAKERMDRYGPNRMPEAFARSGWSMFADQFKSLPALLLGLAAGVSLLCGGMLDAAVILGVLVADATIGYITERRAEKTINSLRSTVRPYAKVLREDRVLDVSADEVVLGDILVLRPGIYVAADARLIESRHLTVDESALTGESLPSVKSANATVGDDTPLAGRINMAYMGTVVTGGEGLGIVVATGQHTEIGKVQLLLQHTCSPKTPIERQLDQIGRQLVIIGLGVCAVVFLVGLLRGYGLLQMLRVSIALAAAAVPEALPAAATTTLALGIRRMGQHHVLVRRLEAVETLGCVQTICLDKTGTITRNRMTVVRVCSGNVSYKVTKDGCILDGRVVSAEASVGLRLLGEIAVLCSETEILNRGGDEDGWVLKGSPTENALVEFARILGVDVLGLRKEHTLLKVNHRAENRLFMSTLHFCPQKGFLLAVKGSPKEVLAYCDKWLVDGREVPLREQDRFEIENQNDKMAGEALRVLGFAMRLEYNGQDMEVEGKLTWLGLIGMMDPIREGVAKLIAAFHRAGINTVMITGDQSPTAFAVAKELGLSQGEPIEILDSSELSSVDPEALRLLGRKVHVYSRVSPAHKLMIVQALQSSGTVVAMTGDGVNDGPALKAADVGIAMGRTGTDVAREVADVVLEKDNLETLIMAVQDGRVTYSNIKKSVHFFLSTNFSELMVVAGAMAFGLGTPLNTMQLLWINIISDICPGLALAMEQAESDVLEESPRDPLEPIITSGDFVAMLRESAMLSATTLGAYAYGLIRYGPGASAGGIAFQSLTVGQLLHAVCCRSRRRTVFDRGKTPGNKYLNIALGGSLLLQTLTALLPGLRSVLGISPLALMDTVVIGGTALLSLVLNETAKVRAQKEKRVWNSGTKVFQTPVTDYGGHSLGKSRAEDLSIDLPQAKPPIKGGEKPLMNFVDVSPGWV